MKFEFSRVRLNLAESAEPSALIAYTTHAACQERLVCLLKHVWRVCTWCARHGHVLQTAPLLACAA